MQDEGASAFTFRGDWREYAPIAFTNLLLSIVTLGVYSFWARSRTRRYLWSRTRLIDDRLEWTGTGWELFLGYLLAVVLFGAPLAIVQFGLQGLVLRGHVGAAIATGAVLYLFLLWIVGVARFRALRYRLSRTWWHGIRGGSDDQGVGFGGQYLGRTLAGMATLGLMTPWSMTTLWNRRWTAMSFGSLRFHAEARWRPVFKRFLLFYLLPFALFGIGVVVALIGVGSGVATTGGAPEPGSLVLGGLVFVVGFYGVLGAVALAFFAGFFREAIGHTTLGQLRFGFTARTIDWVKLFLGNIGLVIVTFGIGYIFVSYRNWAFFARHLELYGTVHLDDLLQSATRLPGQGEGLLDALDVGAF